jgi:hypothetical protein
VSGHSVETGVGVVVLRRPTEAEVIALEEARRQLLAPVAPNAPITSLDDGRDTIRVCITNMTPEAAQQLLRKYPGIVKRYLVEAFRRAGEAGDGFERDPAVITHEHRKTFKDLELVGLRCFDVPVVLRPVSEERHTLIEIRTARDAVGFGVPFSETAAVGREHMISPKADSDEGKALFAEHPYLAVDLGRLLLEMASGRDADLLGKLKSYSPPEKTTSSSPPNASSSPDSEKAGGSESAPPA